MRQLAKVPGSFNSSDRQLSVTLRVVTQERNKGRKRQKQRKK
jgi:hypothetical protein